MTNMMISKIYNGIEDINQQYKFCLELYEAVIRLNKYYLMPDKQKGLVNQKTSDDLKAEDVEGPEESRNSRDAN